MWQSMLDVTAIILHELWTALLKTWDFFKLWFSSSERLEIQIWLEKYLLYAPDDFSDSWRDGRLLAILLNRLHPGCLPDANQLDPDYGLRNVYKVFDVLEMYFGIKPSVSVEEIVTCAEGSDSKLLAILLELKQTNENQPENERIIPETDLNENIEQHSISHSCIAKGTGLAVGFVGRITSFIIFYAVISDLDVVVEIRGPNTVCSERITKRSPKKKRSIKSWEYSRFITRSVSYYEQNNELEIEEDETEKRIIPLEYEIIGNQISFDYKPRESGNHKVTILWHGQNVSDSPYTVMVEDPKEMIGANNVVHLKSALKSAMETEKNDLRKTSVRFQESLTKSIEQKRHFGKVLSKRVLGYIVKINGKYVPVNAESTETLAEELLKMDCDFEQSLSNHRRSSWGFTGDSERKRSAIRQFCVGVDELDAQLSQRRSRSLTINTGYKTCLDKRNSVDSLTSKLKIVKEDNFESAGNFHINDNEEDYAILNENLDITLEDAEVKQGEKSNVEKQIPPEREVLESIKYSEDTDVLNILERSDETDIEAISSLSTKDKIDNLNEDIQLDVFSNFLVLYSNASKKGSSKEVFIKEDNSKEVFIKEDNSKEVSIKENFHDLLNVEPNSVVLGDIDAKPSIKLKSPIFKKTITKNSKTKSQSSQTKFRIRPYKVSNESGLPKTVEINTFPSKISENKNSVESQYVASKMGNDCMLELKGIISSNASCSYENETSFTPNNLECKPDEQMNFTQLYNKKSNMSFKQSTNDTTNSTNNLISEMQTLADNTGNKEITDLSSFLNIPDGREETLDVDEKLKCSTQDPKCKKTYQNLCSSEISSAPDGHKEIKDTNEKFKSFTQDPKCKKFYQNQCSNETCSTSDCCKKAIDTKEKLKSSIKDPKYKKSYQKQCSNETSSSAYGHNETIDTKEKLKSSAQDPKYKKSYQNQCSNKTPPAQLQVNNTGTDNNTGDSKRLKTHILKPFSQFNFKQFNSFLETQDYISPVQSQIVHWESSLSSENEDSVLKQPCTFETGEVNIKEKLAFWENTCKKKRNFSKSKATESNKFDATASQSFSTSFENNSNDLFSTDGDLNSCDATIKEYKANCNLINKETKNRVSKEKSDEKISAELQPITGGTQRRSFSDPGFLETTNDEPEPCSISSNLEYSSKEYLCSSNDDNFREYQGDEESGCSTDCPRQSSEDEYIDDEIPESAAEYWGGFGALKSLKLSRCDDYSTWGEEFLQNHCYPAKSYPEECKVFGIAVYYGYVAVKNRFQVFTGDAGFGTLSVNVQGFGQHNVSLVSVVYVRNDIYEVTYQVMTAGYYIISIRWMDTAIPGSPFVCKVTF